VRRSGMLPKVSKSARRLGWAAAVAAAVMVDAPPAASGSPQDGPHARSSAVAGAVYGGITPQGFPVMLELSRNRRQVVRAVIGLHLACTSGDISRQADRYNKMVVSTKGKFRTSFGPDTLRIPDGTTQDFEGSISGAFNRARTKLSGKWQLKVTIRDAAGTVTDTCDSGNVSWNAKQ
jgi:hypothetical protein